MACQELYLTLAVVFGALMAFGIGANDVSNAVGTSVGSRSITIKQAIIIAAIFEFLGAFIAGNEVTSTIRQDIVNSTILEQNSHIFIIGMLAALLSAGIWLLLASVLGWPVSTTHTIVGAIVGFGIMVDGFDGVYWHNVLSIFLGWLASPFLGAVIAYATFISTQKLIFNSKNAIAAAKKYIPWYIFLVAWIIFILVISKSYLLGIYLSIPKIFAASFALALIAMLIGKKLIQNLKLKPSADADFHFTNVEKIFSILMIFTACAMAFAHGSNDVANAIGPVAAIAAATKNPDLIFNDNSVIPVWILLLGSCSIVVGLAVYGHKVIATVGDKITQLTPSRGFAATLSASATVVLASSSGLPISTTHTLVGAILGVGLARGVHALNLNVIRTIILSWLITVPAGAFLAIIFYQLLKWILL